MGDAALLTGLQSAFFLLVALLCISACSPNIFYQAVSRPPSTLRSTRLFARLRAHVYHICFRERNTSSTHRPCASSSSASLCPAAKTLRYLKLDFWRRFPLRYRSLSPPDLCLKFQPSIDGTDRQVLSLRCPSRSLASASPVADSPVMSSHRNTLVLTLSYYPPLT